MPWSNARPRAKRYDAAHARTRAAHLAALERTGTGICAERVCIKATRLITPDMDLHLAHDPTGTVVLGLAHADCNRHEAAVRARRMQARGPSSTARRSPLRW